MDALSGSVRIVTLLFMLALGSAILHAQNPGDDPYNFDDIPSDQVRSFYYGLGGGYLGSLLVVNYDGVNELGSSLSVPEISGPLLLNGGGGFLPVFFIDPHIRLGFYGMGGSKKVTTDLTVGGEGVTRSLDFSQTLAAAQIDYAIRLSGTLTLVPGTMIGASTLDLEVTQSRRSGTARGVLFPDSGGAGFNAHLTSTRIFYYPAVNVEWAPVKVLMLRLGGGYAGTFDADWKDNNTTVVGDMPKIGTNGPVLQFGLFVGLFQVN